MDPSAFFASDRKAALGEFAAVMDDGDDSMMGGGPDDTGPLGALGRKSRSRRSGAQFLIDGDVNLLDNDNSSPPGGHHHNAH